MNGPTRKASYDRIDDASASATLSGSAGFLPSKTILRKMPADTLLPAIASTGRSAQADRFPCKRQSRTVFQHRPGTLDIPLRDLDQPWKMQRRTAIPHFREPQSDAANFKRHYACGVSSPPLLRLRLRFRLRRRPRSRLPQLPSPRPSPWRDSTFAAATTPSAGTGPALFAPSRPRLLPRPPLRPFPPRPDPPRPRRPPRPEKAAGLYSGPAPTASGKDNFGISRSINSSIRWNFPCSSSFTKVTARPVALARAVRPMRWM